MTDPTPRPPAGTDIAPCPDCGGELEPMRSAFEPDEELAFRCPHCEREIDHVRDQCVVTLAGAPWTRALWAEVERLRRIKHDLEEEIVEQSMAFNRKVVNAGMRVGLQKIGMGATPCTVDDFVTEVEHLRAEAAELRLVLAAEQGRQEGAPSAGWEFKWDRVWEKSAPDDERYCVSMGTDDSTLWYSGYDFEEQSHPNARAAMKVADALIAQAEAQAAAKEHAP